MEEAQLFRLAGTSAVKKISCDHVDGQSVIYWEDIEHFFTGVRHVMNGETFVKLLRDSNRNRIIPHCIKHQPGAILDVVLSSSDGDTSATTGNRNGTSNPGLNDITQPPLYTSGSDGIAGMLSSGRVTENAQKNAIESEIERDLLLSLPSEFQGKVLASPNIHDALVQAVMDGLVDRPNEHLVVFLRRIKSEVVRNGELASRVMGLTSKNNALLSRLVDLATQNGELAFQKNQVVLENKELMSRANKLQEDLGRRKDEMERLQVQALDRLALLQKSVTALLTQTYELYEYPIPRLFIVLPEDSSLWNPLDHLTHKFRLYFLCECGEHTRLINTRIPHHIHLAKHEGYELARPTEFFQRYGRYVLAILQMLKYGLTVTGIAIPALTQLIRPDDVDKVKEGLKSLTDTLEPGVNQVIEYIEKVTAEQGQSVVELSQHMDSNEALEGADPRQLELFLKTKDEHRVLGNLYRTVTGEGHVKWVCIDHYRENYHEKAANTFRDAVATLHGVFDENIGRVEVTLKSKVQAEQFYQGLEKARSVYELEIHLDWETTQVDFKRLRNAFFKTSVGVLELHLWNTDGPISDLLNRSQRYDPIIDIMRHPSIKSFTIRGPRNFSKRSSLLSRDNEFPNLRHLDISLDQLKDDIHGVKSLVAKAPNLSCLITRTSGCENSHLLAFYNAIAENQTYQIIFKDSNFSIPPPSPRGQSVAACRYLQDLMNGRFRYSGEQILDGDKLDESSMVMLAKTVGGSLRFNVLELKRADQLGDAFIKNLSSIVAQSELRAIRIWMEEDEGRMRILSSIQWKHLHVLEVRLKPGTLETNVVKTLTAGVEKASGQVNLKDFRFYSDCYKFIDDPLSMPEANLLQSFIASTPLESLLLEMILTLEQVLSLLMLVDESRLQSLTLWTKGFGSIDVEAILHGLQNAAKLKTLKLLRAEISDEQVDRMQEREVTLSNTW